MPIALIKCVREVSSEDSVHVAANLLNPVVSKKWKTKNAGEKSAYVILELEEPHGITGIDIGNERSAFVEVLVAKSGNSEDDFTDILITCSFMTPIESKNLTNPNRVRCFGQNALVESKLETKWQLIKVLCTQPFNKHIQYGLSFIKVHVSENTNKNTLGLKSFTSEKFKHTDLNLQNRCDDETKKIKLSVGQFYFREDSPDSDSVAGLFSRWKTTRQKKVDVSLSNAYAIREASSLGTSSRISESALKPKSALKIPCTSGHRENFSIEPHVLPDRNRVELYFGNENPSDKIPKKSQTIQILNHQSKGDCEVQERGELEYNTAITTQKDDLNSKSAGKSEQKIKFRPFNKLLDGVVVVMSGIQNPNRADLRNKALAMGARYKGDWEIGCTHLICAFKNTPKYIQVRGKGKIVTSKWIERCYESQKYLPWRRFALDSKEFDKPESDEEIFDESKRHAAFTESCYNDFTEDNGSKLQTEIMGPSSGSDTDDDINRAVFTNLQRNIAKQPNISPKKNEVTKKRESIYEVLTEEEDFLKDKYMSKS